MTRAALYVRVSTYEQAHNGTSLDTQIRVGTQYIESHGMTLVEVYADAGKTAKQDAERPELARLLADSAAGLFDFVVFQKIDRFGRSVKNITQHLSLLEDGGVGFEATDESIGGQSPQDRLKRNMLAAFAEFEHARIVERTREGKHSTLLQGRWPGGPAPFGLHYDKNSRSLHYNDTEIASLQRAIELLVDHDITTGQAAAVLNAEGHFSRHRTWTVQRLRTTLVNADYLSGTKTVNFCGLDYEVTVPPIIGADRHAELNARLNRTAFNQRRGARRYMLSERLTSMCGTGMRGKFRNDSGTAQYRCPASPACGCHAVDQNVIESRVWEGLMRFWNNPEAIAALVASNPDIDPAEHPERIIASESALTAEIEQLRAATADRIAQLIRTGMLDDDMIASIKANLDADIASKEAQLRQVRDFRNRFARRAEFAQQATTLMDTVHANMTDPDPELRRDIMRLLQVHVTLTGYRTCPTCAGSKVVISDTPAPTGWRTSGGVAASCPTCRHYGALPILQVRCDLLAGVGQPLPVKFAA